MNLLDVENGRGRRILPWIIERSNSGDEFAAFEVTSRSLLHLQLWAAVHVPEELAEMMLAEGQRLGLTMKCWVDKTIPTIEFQLSWGMRRSLATRDTRSVFAQWLELPDGARRQAEKVLGGESILGGESNG